MSCSRLLELMLKAAVTEKTLQKEFGANFSPVETKKRIEPAEKMPPISKLVVFFFFKANYPDLQKAAQALFSRRKPTEGTALLSVPGGRRRWSRRISALLGC